jgi:hypothetical protein
MAQTPYEILLKVLGTESVKQALDQLDSSITTTTEKFEALDRQTQSTSASMESTFTGGAMSTGRDALKGFSDETLHAKDALGGLNPSITEFGKQFHNAASGPPKLTSALDQVGVKTKSLGEIGRGLAGVLQQQMGSMIAVTGSAIGLFEAYDSVGDSQLAVDKAQRALMTSTNTLATLELRLSNAVLKYGADSAQVAVIQDKIAAQRLDITNKTGDLQNAEENLAIVQTHFAKEIGPLMMAVGGNIMQMFANGRQTINGLRETFTGLIPAVRGATGAMTAMGLVPWLLPLTIASGVIIAFTTNLFGFRDAINAAGEAIGNAIPMLRPFLEMIGAAGQWLTDTFGGGSEAANEFSGEFGGAMDEAGNSLNTFGEKVDTEFEDMIARMENTAKTFKEKANEIREDYNQTVTLGKDTFTGAPSTASPTGTKLGSYNHFGSSGLENYDTSLQNLMVTYSNVAGEGERFYTGLDSIRTLAEELGISFDEAVAKVSDAGVILLENGSIVAASQHKIADSMDESAQSATNEKDKILQNTAAKLGNVLATEGLTESYNKLTQEHSHYMGIQQSATAQDDLRKIAILEVQTEFMKMGVETVALVEKTKIYNEALADSRFTITLFNKGAAEYRASLTEMNMSTETLKGTLAAMQTTWNSGEAAIVTFNKAMVDAQIGIEQSKLEVVALNATFAAMFQSFSTGEAQQTAFNKGLIEGRTAILEYARSLWERLGALNANIEALQDGTIQQGAHSEAIIKNREAVVEAQIEYEKLSEDINHFNDFLESGIPQAQAYAKSLLEVRQATQQVDIELAQAIATYDGLKETLTDTDLYLKQAKMHFAEGAAEAINWRDSINKAANGQWGFLAGLEDIAVSLGEDMPTALYGSTEAMKEWLAVQMGAPAAIQKGLKAAIDAAKESLDEFREAWDKGDNLSENEIEKILGMNIPDDYEKKINMHFRFEHNESKIEEDIKKIIGIFAEVGAPHTKAEADKIVDNLKDGLQEAFDNGQIGEQFYSSMMQVLGQMPDPQDVPEWNEWIAQFDALWTALESGDPQIIKDTVTAITERRQQIKETADYYKELSENIDAYLESIKGKESLTKEETDEGTANMLSLVESFNQQTQNQTLGGTQGYNDDNTEISGGDQDALANAQSKLEEFKLALQELPGFITGVVADGNTSFLPLGDPFLVEIPKKVLDFSTTLQKMPSFMTTSVVTPTNNALKPLGDPFLKEIPQKVLQFSTTIQKMPTFIATKVAAPIVSEFNSMANSLAQGPFNRITTSAAATFQGVTNIARTEAPKMEGPFSTAVSNIIARLNDLQTQASSKFGIIQSDAQEAAGAVAGLVSAINQLESKTVTITTIHEDIYQTTYAAAGMGPTIVDHPTNIKVGESGPEFVQVIPLSSNANKNLSAQERLNIYGDPGKKRQNTAPLYQMAQGNFPEGFPFHNTGAPNGANGQNGQNGANGVGNNINTQNDNGINGNEPLLDDVVDGDWVNVNVVAVGGRPVTSTNNALPIFQTGSSSVNGSSSSSSSSSGNNISSQTNNQSSQIITNGTIGTFGGAVHTSSVQQGPIYGQSSPLGNITDVGNNISSQFQGINSQGVFQNGQIVLFNGQVIQGGDTTGENANTSENGIYQSQSRSQSSSITSGGSIIGQGNNINFQYQYNSGNNVSGTIGPNGKIIGSNGYPTDASSGSILEPLRGRYRSGQDNQFGIYDFGPATPNFETAISPCAIREGLANSNGGSGNTTIDILKNIRDLLKNLGIVTNINVPLDGNQIYKNQIKKYLGNMGTFLT